MLFHSPAFLFVLLPLSLLLLKVLPAGRARLSALFFVSYLFYSGTEPWFVVLLLASSCVDFGVALAIHASRSTATRRAWLMISIAGNLGFLGFFKYAGWLLPMVTPALARAGLPTPDPDFFRSFSLPAGISFYTFQSMSYTFDVYRGAVTPTRSLLGFCTYVAYLPQLIAGPIERYADLAPQIQALVGGRSRPDLSAGVDRLLLGIIQKLLLADACAQIVDPLVPQLVHPDFVTAWAFALGFGMQIYFDFAAYTHMAIGIALMMGVRLSENFLAPYQSASIQEFWRRWHVTLSNWFRDYLYVPLGGSRHGSIRTLANVVITFTLCGLWHGAGWNFLLWGALHGVMLGLYRVKQSLLPSLVLPRAAAVALTFTLVNAAWVPFRLRDPASVLDVWLGMIGRHGFDAAAVSAPDLLFLGLLVTGVMLVPAAAGRWPGRSGWAESTALAAVALIAVFSAPAVTRFIYFQF
jgi:alginate O-acetyltransferase complex protein AlgI